MSQEETLRTDTASPVVHLLVALVGAAILVFGARALTDNAAATFRPAATVAIAAPLASNPAAEQERIEAAARADRQAMEKRLIEEDRVRREQKKQEILRAREAEVAATQAADDAKDKAWQRYYKPAQKCGNPADDSARIDCSNQYMRARERFEKLYADGKLN